MKQFCSQGPEELEQTAMHHPHKSSKDFSSLASTNPAMQFRPTAVFLANLSPPLINKFTHISSLCRKYGKPQEDMCPIAWNLPLTGQLNHQSSVCERPWYTSGNYHERAGSALYSYLPVCSKHGTVWIICSHIYCVNGVKVATVPFMYMSCRHRP